MDAGVEAQAGPSIEWSVIIPAYNEARRLPRYLDEVVAYFESRGDAFEVLVVDDGSADGTAAVVTAAAARHPAVRLIRHARNSGKGFAVSAGMRAARGRYRLFTDADGATPIAEVKRLEAALASGADIAIGSRALRDPTVAVAARPHRVAAGRVFNSFVALLGLRGIEDSQCGFKAFTAVAAERVFGGLRTHGFGFDVEALFLARRAGFRIAEVAVNWSDQAGSKVGVLTDGLGMVWQILRARLRLRREGG